MKNEPRHLSQSEKKKYFEWIINEFMVLHMMLQKLDGELGRPLHINQTTKVWM